MFNSWWWIFWLLFQAQINTKQHFKTQCRKTKQLRLTDINSCISL